MLSSWVKEIIFVKISKGRYKIFLISHLSGLVIISQEEMSLFLNLEYDKEYDAIHIKNIREKYRIMKAVQLDKKIKEV